MVLEYLDLDLDQIWKEQGSDYRNWHHFGTPLWRNSQWVSDDYMIAYIYIYRWVETDAVTQFRYYVLSILCYAYTQLDFFSYENGFFFDFIKKIKKRSKFEFKLHLLHCHTCLEHLFWILNFFSSTFFPTYLKEKLNWMENSPIILF